MEIHSEIQELGGDEQQRRGPDDLVAGLLDGGREIGDINRGGR